MRNGANKGNLMALFVRQKKNKNVRNAHPAYSTQPQKLIEKDREENMPRVRRNLIAIVAVMILILIIIMAAIINAVYRPQDSDVLITAADTFAISQYEQEQMSEVAQDFGRYIAMWSYCSDESAALSAKNAALALTGTNSNAYSAIEQLEQAYPVIEAKDLAPVVTEPTASTPGVAVAQSMTFLLDCAAADLSVKTDETPNGTFADPGLSLTVEFTLADDEATEDTIWVISNVSIRSKTVSTSSDVEEYESYGTYESDDETE